MENKVFLALWPWLNLRGGLGFHLLTVLQGYFSG